MSRKQMNGRIGSWTAGAAFISPEFFSPAFSQESWVKGGNLLTHPEKSAVARGERTRLTPGTDVGGRLEVRSVSDGEYRVRVPQSSTGVIDSCVWGGEREGEKVSFGPAPPAGGRVGQV